MTVDLVALQETPASEPPPHTPEEARAFLDEFRAAMASLVATIAEETALVRAGRLFAATDVASRKTEQLGRYLRLRIRLKRDWSEIGRLTAVDVDDMREEHMAAIEAVRANLGVLSVAREVAEGIVRNVSATVGRQAAPRTYGRNAAAPPPLAAAARGIAVDRRM